MLLPSLLTLLLANAASAIAFSMLILAFTPAVLAFWSLRSCAALSCLLAVVFMHFWRCYWVSVWFDWR
ncbi:MAG: hypothetical protein K0U66_01740 [Gammaproteobacteria bacterium]|nr:hypothetical protein [Gammaproteobacteria bacterium]